MPLSIKQKKSGTSVTFPENLSERKEIWNRDHRKKNFQRHFAFSRNSFEGRRPQVGWSRRGAARALSNLPYQVKNDNCQDSLFTSGGLPYLNNINSHLIGSTSSVIRSGALTTPTEVPIIMSTPTSEYHIAGNVNTIGHTGPMGESDHHKNGAFNGHGPSGTVNIHYYGQDQCEPKSKSLPQDGQSIAPAVEATQEVRPSPVYSPPQAADPTKGTPCPAHQVQ